ncbi:MAG TPA: RluA family pseudouridine synthase, partial [Thermoleophilia bacterium]|nr:RluA family pseudouridine synthase [Thermoleophilia bacterium]
MSTAAGEGPFVAGQHSFVVTETEEGQRLDVYLGSMPSIGSRSQASLLFEQGSVEVNGRVRPKSFRLTSGDSVRVVFSDVPSPPAQASSRSVPVVYEDEWLLVADKPADMVVHPAKGHAADTLVDALRGHGLAGGEEFRPGIVHRLDKDTSGLLVVAKDVAVHRALQQSIRQRLVDRRYLALVHGDISTPTGTIEAPIGRDRQRRKNMAVGGAAARDAVTHFTVVERFGLFTLVEARLETGRTHQIRVHFLAIGHPVVGDPTYARRDALGLGRQFLHSHRLRLRHPVGGAELDLSSPLPADLAGVLD